MSNNENKKAMSIFERYLTLWVGLCIVAGILLGKIAPGAATFLDGLAIKVNGAPVVSIPIAICLFFNADAQRLPNNAENVKEIRGICGFLKLP